MNENKIVNMEPQVTKLLQSNVIMINKTELTESNVINKTDMETIAPETRRNPFLESIMRAPSYHESQIQVCPDMSILSLLEDSYKLPEGVIVDYRPLSITSSKFKQIEAMFPSSLKVLNVQEVINPFLRMSFLISQNLTYSGMEPKMLFHGTKLEYVHNICTDNFNWRFAGLGRGYKYGKGVYFTHSPKFAMNFCDQKAADKVAILADVLVRNTACGEKGMDLPPDGCDTTCGKHRTFVKFSDGEFYPHYVIFFRKNKKVGFNVNNEF